MSPCEIVAFAVDFILGNPEALTQHSPPPPQYTPYTTSQADEEVSFENPSDLCRWKRQFPSPDVTPAIGTRSLCFHNVESTTDDDSKWIRSFIRLERLELSIKTHLSCLDPFKAISPHPKFLKIDWGELPLQKVFDLIFSFPSLEHLHILDAGCGKGEDIDLSRNRPELTGTLLLEPMNADFVRQLLRLPDGLCFREIV